MTPLPLRTIPTTGTHRPPAAWAWLLALALAFPGGLWAQDEPPAAEATPAETSPDAQLISLDGLRQIEKQVKQLTADVMSRVVCVRVGPSQGSGIVVTEDGYVLTAGHVVGEPNKDVVFIFADGKKAKGKKAEKQAREKASENKSDKKSGDKPKKSDGGSSK